MRGFIAITATVAILAGYAAAQSTWQEYTYPDQQFAVSFPAEPAITAQSYKAADGMMVPETIYSVQQETGQFRVAVIDFENTGIDQKTAVDKAIADLRAKGDVKLDIPARVQRNFGRYINIASADGSHTIASVFFGGNRLYELEGTVPASNPDALSGEMIRFQQSLRFMGDAAGGRGFGRGLRGQFQGRGGRFRQAPAAQAPDTTNL